MYASINIQGAEELEKKLESFEPKLGRKIIRQALRGCKSFTSSRKKQCKLCYRR